MKRDEYNSFLRKVKCSDEFRSRMQQKLSSAPAETTEYADSVSGTDVITAKHRFGRAAALAAAFVIVCGAVGGGAYQLVRYNFKTGQRTGADNQIDTDKIDRNAPILDNMRANKDCFTTDLVLWNGYVGNVCTLSDVDTNKFFEYMDNYGTPADLSADDFTSTLRAIKLYFDCKTGEMKNHCYALELYDNGLFILRENDKGHVVKDEERESYHIFSNGYKVFHELLNLYADSETIADFEQVTEKEIEEQLLNGFRNGIFDKADYFVHVNRQEEYTVTDKEEFANELMEFEWERAFAMNGDVNHYYLGFTATEDGYMQFSNYMTYKLKNDSDLEAYNAVLKKHLIKKDFGEAVSEEDILNAFKDIPEDKAQFFDKSGLKTTFCKYNESDFEGFREKLASLEWETCSKVELEFEQVLTVKNCLIDLNGIIVSANKDNPCYKLKNESDKAEFRSIIDEFMESFEETESE
ncbi:MAG: hypothetical protein IKH78_05625 [Ruminococcus sp.]|nr:hypothetical protein [Ruminococcus sp.]